MSEAPVKFNMILTNEMAKALDEEAEEIGISRASLIKIVLHNHLKEVNNGKASSTEDRPGKLRDVSRDA